MRSFRPRRKDVAEVLHSRIYCAIVSSAGCKLRPLRHAMAASSVTLPRLPLHREPRSDSSGSGRSWAKPLSCEV